MSDESSEDKILIASFDVGRNNFAFYVELVDLSILRSLVDVPVKHRYQKDGSPTEKFGATLEGVYSSGKCIILCNNNISGGAKKRKYFDLSSCLIMNDLLDQYSEIWDKVSFVIVELQRSVNTLCIKLAQNCESYFMLRYGASKKVFEFPSTLKTQILGAPKILGTNGKYKCVGKPERKKWAVDKTSSILADRGDFTTLASLGCYTKAYDKADCVVQAQAWKYLYFVAKGKLPDYLL